MPLLALTLTDDPRLLALTTLAIFLPWLLIGLPAGVMVDRFDRRRLMVCANVIRVALFSLVAIGAAAGWLDIPILVGLLLDDRLLRGAVRQQRPGVPAADRAARLSSGVPTAICSRPKSWPGASWGCRSAPCCSTAGVGLPFAINAASFAVAAALIATIRVARARYVAPAPAKPDWALGVGLRFLWSDRLLRTLAMMFTVTNLGLMFGQGVFVMYAVDELGLSSGEFGVLLAITAMGAATGGLIGHRVMTTLGVRTAVVAPYLAFGLGNVVIGVGHVGVGGRSDGLRAGGVDHGVERRDRDRAPARHPGRPLRPRERRLPLARRGGERGRCRRRRLRRQPVVGAHAVRRRRRRHRDRRAAVRPASARRTGRRHEPISWRSCRRCRARRLRRRSRRSHR